MILEDFLKLGFEEKKSREAICRRPLLKSDLEYDEIDNEIYKFLIENINYTESEFWNFAVEVCHNRNCIINYLSGSSENFKHLVADKEEKCLQINISLENKISLFLICDIKSHLIYRIYDDSDYYRSESLYTSNIYNISDKMNSDDPISILNKLLIQRSKNIQLTKNKYNKRLRKLHEEYREALKSSKNGIDMLEKIIKNHNSE